MKKEDIKDIKKQVIAGLILAAILAAVSTIFGWWPLIFNLLKNIIDLLANKSLMPNWLVLILCLLSAILLYEKIRKIITRFRSPKQIPKERKTTAKELGLLGRLSKIDENILLFLSHHDGESIHFRIMLDQLKLSATKLKYHLEELRRNYYIRESSSYPDSYYIAHQGRSYLVNNKLIDT